MSIRKGFNLLAQGLTAVGAAALVTTVGSLGVITADQISELFGGEGFVDNVEALGFAVSAYGTTVISGLSGILGLALTHEEGSESAPELAETSIDGSGISGFDLCSNPCSNIYLDCSDEPPPSTDGSAISSFDLCSNIYLNCSCEPAA